VRELVRQGYKGVRGAEVTVSRVLAVAAWLRDEGKIHDTACIPPRRWKLELAGFWKDEVGSRMNYKPSRPRHSAKELRSIVDHSWHVDPRFGLMMELGFSLRLGQVRLSRRSDLDLQAGTFTVHGDGKKEGAVIQLNEVQLEAVQKALGGYLRVLEAIEADYHLFPGGRLRQAVAHVDDGPCSRMVIGKWFRLAEKLAGVAHVPGRAAYGLRRQAVDGTEELQVSDRARQIAGGGRTSRRPTPSMPTSSRSGP
jgi:integrase